MVVEQDLLKVELLKGDPAPTPSALALTTPKQNVPLWQIQNISVEKRSWLHKRRSLYYTALHCIAFHYTHVLIFGTQAVVEEARSCASRIPRDHPATMLGTKPRPLPGPSYMSEDQKGTDHGAYTESAILIGTVV